MRRKVLYLGLDSTRFKTEGELVHCPLIRTRLIPPNAPMLREAERLFSSFTHILFTSRTTVGAVQTLFPHYPWKECTLLAIGRATSELLPHALLAPAATAEGVVELLKTLSIGSLFYPHSESARPVIRHFLEGAATPHYACTLYQTLPVEEPPPLDLASFSEIIFTSPSTVQAFHRLFGTPPKGVTCTPIGPITREALAGIIKI